MRRRTAVLGVCSALLLTAPVVHAAGTARSTAVKAPVVALLDTGVRATHREFDFRGARSSSDQFVGWWDFTSEVKPAIVLPAPGQTWDTTVKTPYDKHGHGTMTAAMAGGLGASPEKTPSAAPGTKLAIAKVGNADGAIQGDLAAAVRWATDTIRADVINISIGSIVPVPTLVAQANYDAIAYARGKGVLVVVANGNGFANLGIGPGDPGWASFYASSPSVLAVGAAGTQGYVVSTDPELTAVYSVTGPSKDNDTAYRTAGGTSFSSPYVAGFAASLLEAARAGGRALDVNRLEQLLKSSATDTATPPQFEGYGVLSQSELAGARGHARAGTLPTRPSPDPSGLYVESVAGTLRTAWSG